MTLQFPLWLSSPSTTSCTTSVASSYPKNRHFWNWMKMGEEQKSRKRQTSISKKNVSRNSSCLGRVTRGWNGYMSLVCAPFHFFRFPLNPLLSWTSILCSACWARSDYRRLGRKSCETLGLACSCTSPAGECGLEYWSIHRVSRWLYFKS